MGADPWGPVLPPWTLSQPRQAIRALRSETNQWLVALDDDPTGSQGMHSVEVVFNLDSQEYERALTGPSQTCFVLTNSRSQPVAHAVELTERVASDVIGLAQRHGASVQLVSRGDSTLRGHVVAEAEALRRSVETASSRPVDGVVFAPAFIEAGRVTVDDVHWARVGDAFRPVGETEFSRDSAFGFDASDLREYLVEVGRGQIARDQIRSIGLEQIRAGGPEQIAELLTSLSDCTYVVVNALERSDLDVVALGMLLAQQAGKILVARSGPSLVRSLDGQEPIAPLSTEWMHRNLEGHGHGLVVVGSHVGLTSLQVDALRRSTKLHEVIVDVDAVLDCDDLHYLVDRYASDVTSSLTDDDVLILTSRTLVNGVDKEDNLRISRTVSGVVADIVRESSAGRPAWVVAKGGITSHDVAVRGLGIPRAHLAGQLFEGVVSLFLPAADAVGGQAPPFVVFAGNVGNEESLLNVVKRLRGDG